MSRTIKGLTVRKMTVTDTLISGKMRHELWDQLSTNISWISNASLTDASAKAGVPFCLISLRLALPKWYTRLCKWMPRATGSLFRWDLGYEAISPSRCCVCFGKNNQKRLSGTGNYRALFISTHRKHPIAFGPSKLGVR